MRKFRIILRLFITIILGYFCSYSFGSNIVPEISEAEIYLLDYSGKKQPFCLHDIEAFETPEGKRYTNVHIYSDEEQKFLTVRTKSSIDMIKKSLDKVSTEGWEFYHTSKKCIVQKDFISGYPMYVGKKIMVQCRYKKYNVTRPNKEKLMEVIKENEFLTTSSSPSEFSSNKTNDGLDNVVNKKAATPKDVSNNKENQIDFFIQRMGLQTKSGTMSLEEMASKEARKKFLKEYESLSIEEIQQKHLEIEKRLWEMTAKQISNVQPLIQKMNEIQKNKLSQTRSGKNR